MIRDEIKKIIHKHYSQYTTGKAVEECVDEILALDKETEHENQIRSILDSAAYIGGWNAAIEAAKGAVPKRVSVTRFYSSENVGDQQLFSNGFNVARVEILESLNSLKK